MLGTLLFMFLRLVMSLDVTVKFVDRGLHFVAPYFFKENENVYDTYDWK